MVKKIVNRGVTAAKKFNKSKYGRTIKKEGSKFLKTSGQKASEKAAPAVGDFIGSKIAYKITSMSGRQQEEPESEAEEQESIIPPKKRQQIINNLRYFKRYSIKMEYQNIINLLDGSIDVAKFPKFITKKWIEVFDQSDGTYNV